MQDIVTPSEFLRMATWMGTPKNENDDSRALRDRTDHLLSYSLMARSQIMRELRLSEIGVEEMSVHYSCYAVRFTILKSKTSQYERTLTCGGAGTLILLIGDINTLNGVLYQLLLYIFLIDFMLKAK
jgi:hypothetical protein